MTIIELEHESGLRPLGDYPDHCRRCRTVAARRERAVRCDHEQIGEARVWGGGIVGRWCYDYGVPLDEDGRVKA